MASTSDITERGTPESSARMIACNACDESPDPICFVRLRGQHNRLSERQTERHRHEQRAAGESRSHYTYYRSRNAKVDRALPAITATYCSPSTSYVIGPLTSWPPRFALQSRSPVLASSAWK